jgi:hypothetical protein
MKLDIKITGVSVNEAQEIIAKLSGQAPALQVNTQATNQNLNQEENHSENDALVGSVAGQVDAEGLPWDARIHSSNKKKTDKGFWVKRRNVEETVYNQVVAEIRSNNAAGLPPFLQNMPNANVSPASFTPPPAMGVSGAAIVQPYSAPANVYTPPVVVPVTQPVYNPPAPAAAPAGDINALFSKITQMFQAGTADAPYMNSLTQRLSQQFQVQVNSVNDIAGRPDIIAHAFLLIANDGK